MRYRRRVIVLALSLLVVGFLGWFMLHARGPSYQGKSLRYWLVQLHANRPFSRAGAAIPPDPQTLAQYSAAATAIKEMGTNALPQLLEGLESKDSPLKQRFLNTLSRVRFLKGSALSEPERRESVVLAFQILGSKASPAIPELAQILNKADLQLNESVANILFSMGSNGIPPLIQALNHTNADVRIAATEALNRYAWITTRRDSGPALDVERIDGFAAIIVPALVPLVADADPVVRQRAAVGLTRFHRLPDIAVPALMKMMGDKDATVRGLAIGSLAVFGTNAQAAVPALVNALKDPELSVSSTATNALRKIDPSAIK